MGHVSALRETPVLFAAIIEALVLKERFGLLRIVPAFIIALGVVIMQIGG